MDDSPHPARVLVVDDSPANLLAMEGILAPLEQEVVSVRSGDDALLHLLRGEFSVILMDVQMPGLDGLETARLIRARERTRYIPIIFITALSREAAHVTRGYQHGGVDYLLKPVDPEILRTKVRVFVELHQQREQVKAQAAELAAQRAARDELLRSRELEEQLLGIVGHDIRSPLSAVLATADHQLASDSLPPGQRRAFQRVLRSGQRIAGLVELLLDFTRARIGGGISLSRRPAELRALCRAVLDEQQAIHPHRDLLLECGEEAVWGEWDPDRLAQVLTNLVDNALKHGADGTPVRLQLVTGPGGEAVLRVHNDGEAIPTEQQDGLFDPFSRAAGKRGREGLGLGLFITRELVRAHGGEISLRSVPGAGTDFELWLPLRLTVGESPTQDKDQLSA
jgi:signal transduction histidine kinase